MVTEEVVDDDEYDPFGDGGDIGGVSKLYSLEGYPCWCGSLNSELGISIR